MIPLSMIVLLGIFHVKLGVLPRKVDKSEQGGHGLKISYNC